MGSLRALAVLTLLLAAAVLAYSALGLPSTEQIEVTAAELVRVHGYSILFAGSLLESMFLVGLAFPGTTILVVGIALGPSIGLQQPSAAISVALGGIIGYTWDYALGRLGWHLILGPHRDPFWLRAHRWVERYGAAGVAAMTAHPFLGAPASVSAGVLGMAPLPFLAVMAVSTVLWASLWTFLLFLVGATTRQWFAPLLSIGWLVLVLAVGLAFKLLRTLLARRS